MIAIHIASPANNYSIVITRVNNITVNIRKSK